MKKIKNIIALIILLFGIKAFAQNTNKNSISYQDVINDRANKIFKKLEVSDSTKAILVRDIIANQYKSLNSFYEEKKTNLSQIFKENSKTQADSISKIYLSEFEIKLNELHQEYLKKLRKELSKKQIDEVKNGMTYSVFPNTYRAYQEMMPDLSKKHKRQIFNYLYEAREHAMDAESSEKKHAWFGKYKGRINNYLSSEGIDMKAVSLAWEKRVREAEEAKKNISSQLK